MQNRQRLTISNPLNNQSVCRLLKKTTLSWSITRCNEILFEVAVKLNSPIGHSLGEWFLNVKPFLDFNDIFDRIVPLIVPDSLAGKYC